MGENGGRKQDREVERDINGNVQQQGQIGDKMHPTVAGILGDLHPTTVGILCENRPQGGGVLSAGQ